MTALSDAQYQKLRAYLLTIPSQIKQYSIFSGADSKIPELGDEVESIKSAVFSLVLSRVRQHRTASEFVAELLETLSDNPGFDGPDKINTLRTRAADILSIGPLDLVARAHDVLTVHACAYSRARILTDIRAVFGDDVSQPPIGAVLVHMLSLNYVNDDRHDTFVVALDDKDVDELIAVLERAKSKSKTLKDTVRATDVPYIEVI